MKRKTSVRLVFEFVNIIFHKGWKCCWKEKYRILKCFWSIFGMYIVKAAMIASVSHLFIFLFLLYAYYIKLTLVLRTRIRFCGLKHKTWGIKFYALLLESKIRIKLLSIHKKKQLLISILKKLFSKDENGIFNSFAYLNCNKIVSRKE